MFGNIGKRLIAGEMLGDVWKRSTAGGLLGDVGKQVSVTDAETPYGGLCISNSRSSSAWRPRHPSNLRCAAPASRLSRTIAAPFAWSPFSTPYGAPSGGLHA